MHRAGAARFLILLVTALGGLCQHCCQSFRTSAPSQRSAVALSLATVTIALSWVACLTTFALH